MRNTMTQGSIDKIYRHAGKLSLIMDMVNDSRRRLDKMDETG